MILEDLFTNVAIFRSYTPFLDSNVTFQELESSARSARKQICVIITSEVYDAIVKAANGEVFESLRTAMANLVLAKQVVFDAINRRKQEVDVYKHEQEAMRRSYTENYYNAMDSLIQDLDAQLGKDLENDLENPYKSWHQTRYYKLLAGLRIKTASDFDTLYPIDSSYLFFFRIIPFQQEAMDDYMASYYERVENVPEGEQVDESLIRRLDRALAMFTVAKSLRQFDIIEFPPTIRSLFDDSKANRTGQHEQDHIFYMSEDLQNQAQTLLQSVDAVLTSNEDGTVSTEESFSQPNDKFYFMP